VRLCGRKKSLVPILGEGEYNVVYGWVGTLAAIRVVSDRAIRGISMRIMSGAIIFFSCGLFVTGAGAQNVHMGHCTDDPSVPPENVIAACTVFITTEYAEGWRIEYIPRAMVYQARAYERLGKYALAEAELKAATEKFRDYTPAWEELGELLEKQNGPGLLMGVLDAMVKANPRDAAVLNSACWIRAEKGEQLETAISNCNESLAIRPGDVDTLDSRAFVHFREGDFAAAIADATAALEANPKLETSLYVRGLAKLKSGDAAGGNADIAAAKKFDPKIADTYAAYGVTQ